MASAAKGTTSATYTHDSFGQRVRKTGPTSIVSTGTHHFVYDEAGRLLGEYNATGGLIQEYVYLADELVAIVRGTTASPQVFYVYTDQVGRPWTVTDTANQLRWQWDTSPFGEFSANQNPAGLGTFTLRLRFPGQYFDAETGLFYNYFRDYDPQTGRYVQSDPIGLAGGLNTFGYASQNPLSLVDPTGEAGLLLAIPLMGSSSAGGLGTLMSLNAAIGVGAWTLANAVDTQSPGERKKKGVEEWNKDPAINPGQYSCRYVMYFPADLCEQGKCPPFVTGRGYSLTLAGAMAQARSEAQGKIPAGCGHQHHGQMWCRYGGGRPFMP
jgi:RHS repeat-associated protein